MEGEVKWEGRGRKEWEITVDGGMEGKGRKGQGTRVVPHPKQKSGCATLCMFVWLSFGPSVCFLRDLLCCLLFANKE